MAAAPSDPSAPTRPRHAVIGLGSNLGDREATLRAAVRDIDALAGVTVTAASELVESAALKPSGVSVTLAGAPSPAYLNAVILATTTLSPLQLLDAVGTIELKHGRVRATTWGDRTLDIDLISIDGIIQTSERLTLPHPQASKRAFVLVPWLQVEPRAVLPEYGPVVHLVSAMRDDAAAVSPYSAGSLLEGVRR